MRNKRQNEQGVIALEACLALTLFMFLMLVMYSFFIVFQAHYSIEHAMLQAGKSLSLETYASNKLIKADGSIMNYFDRDDGGRGNIGEIVTELGLINGIKNPNFISFSKWYMVRSEEREDYLLREEQEVENERQAGIVNGQSVDAVKERFYAYLAGSETEADKLLKKLGVKDGAAGLDFSGTSVSSSDLVIVINYSSKLIFDYPAFRFDELNMTLSSKCRLWK